MMTQDFAGEEIYNVLVNVANFRHVRTTGDHLILKWTPPADYISETRTVAVPTHDSVGTATVRDIAEDAGAQDFGAFCAWVDRHR